MNTDVQDNIEPVASMPVSPGPYLIPARKGILTGAHWGAFEALIEDNRLVGVQPIADDPAPNAMINMAPWQVYAKNRIQCPMVRKSWLLHGPGAHSELRGADEWLPVSWQQAIELVAKEISRVQNDFGPQAVHAGSYGWKSVGMLHNSRNLLYRLMNLTGGFTGHVGDYSTGAAQVIMPHVLGCVEVYQQQTAWPCVVDHTELVVLWGISALTTLKTGWNIPDHEGIAGFAALKDKGTRAISINPIYNDTAKSLNADWLAPHAYTDMPLMLSVAHTLYSEQLYDQVFLQRYSCGFERFLPYLLGESDGQVKNADWAAAICGVAADSIRQLARDMASHRTMIMAGWGIQRQQHGEQVHWMLVTLAAMLGQIGLPGGGFGFAYHSSSGGSPTARGGNLQGISAGRIPQQMPPPIPVARIADCLANPGHSIDYNGRRLTYPDIKLLYIAGGNPLHHHQDTNNLLRAWRHPQTVIVHEPFWTATARHADIVLPVTTSYERNDLEMGGDYSRHYVFPMYQCVEPQHQARNDFDIFSDIAELLGLRHAFTEGKNEMAWLQEMYERMAVQAARVAVDLPPFQHFWQANSYIRFPIPEENRQWVRYADFRRDPLAHPLRTPSGKIEIFSQTIADMGYADCNGHPTWFEPVEWYRSAQAALYPLSLNTSHSPYRLHSQLDNTPLRARYAIADREPITINPADAQARGITDGDLVRAFNSRGQILLGARLSTEIRPGVVCISEGAWFDPVQPGQPGSLCKNGNVNCLTFDLPSSSLSQGNCGHMAQLQIEKYQKYAPQNTAHQGVI